MKCFILQLVFLVVSSGGTHLYLHASQTTPHNALPGSPTYRDVLPYMMGLYDQYRVHRSLPSYKRHSNIVRSFLSSLGEQNDENVLMFNLSVLKPTEKLQKAELHLYKCSFSIHPKQESTEYQLVLFALGPRAAQNMSKVIVLQSSSGWQNIDVTEIITASREISRGGHFSVGVKIDETLDRRREEFGDCIKQTASQTFLTVFSRERNQASIGNTGRQTLDDLINNISLPNATVKHKRSIIDNELPDSPYSNDATTNSSLHHFKSWMNNKKLDSSIIPHPEPLKPYKPFRQRRQRCKKRHHTNRKLPSFWTQEVKQRENIVPFEKEHSPDFKGPCQKRKLVVDVQDIGWSDLVIAPGSFEINFCAGVCSFPLTKHVQPSNHATVQSLVHVINPDIPAPSCVPVSLSSISLLYFDEESNVVLKHFPNMKVEKCACR